MIGQESLPGNKIDNIDRTKTWAHSTTVDGGD